MPHRFTTMPDFVKTFGGWIGSSVGATIMFLAQMTPKEIEGWMSLGGFAILIVCLIYALKYQTKRNEGQASIIEGMFGKLHDLTASAQNKLDEERRRLEGKWDVERRENLDHREKDRDTREKLADAVDKLAEKVTTLNQSGVDGKH